MKIRLVVDRKTCIGSQTCIIEEELTIPAKDRKFELEADGKRVGLRSDTTTKLVRELELEVTEEQKAKYLEIAQLCPTQAIAIFDEQGVQLFPC